MAQEGRLIEIKLKAAAKVIYGLYRHAATGFSYTILFLLYAIIFLFITSITMVIIAVNLEGVHPKGLGPVIVLLVVSMLPGILFFYWYWRGPKWRRDNPQAYQIQQMKRKIDKEAALEVARNAPPTAIEQFITSLIKQVGGIFIAGLVIAIGLVVLYIGYQIITSISVPVAVLIGAVIIGFCILAASG